MPLNVKAQMMEDFVVEEPMVVAPHESGQHLVMYPAHPSRETMMEMHDPENFQDCPEVEEQYPGEIVIQIGELPGVEALDPEMESSLEVSEEEPEDKSEADDSKKSKVAPKWDWQSKGSHGFFSWVKERLDDVPKHSGYDTAGIERAISYLEKLDSEISRAMRLDMDGELDSDKIEEARSKIENGINSLHDRLDKVKKKPRKKKRASEDESGLVKEAQSPIISGIVITVPLLTSALARVLINGSISMGRDMGDMMKRLIQKFKLTDREVYEIVQLMNDMGYPMRWDRGLMPTDEFDPTSEDNFEFGPVYQN